MPNTLLIWTPIGREKSYAIEKKKYNLKYSNKYETCSPYRGPNQECVTRNKTPRICPRHSGPSAPNGSCVRIKHRARCPWDRMKHHATYLCVQIKHRARWLTQTWHAVYLHTYREREMQCISIKEIWFVNYAKYIIALPYRCANTPVCQSVSDRIEHRAMYLIVRIKHRATCP